MERYITIFYSLPTIERIIKDGEIINRKLDFIESNGVYNEITQ